MAFLEFILTWPIIVLGILASLFYGLNAINIFFPKAKVQDTKSEHWSWKVHQFWLNFLGSLVGWIILYFLLKRIDFLKGNNCSFVLSIRDFIYGLLAFIGITGYLPMTIVGLVNSVTSLAQKVIELLTKYITK